MRCSRSWLTHSGDTADDKIVSTFPADIQRLVTTRIHPLQVG